jgi:acetyltransferase-like isoleucine patch superfamily enzyme
LKRAIFLTLFCLLTASAVRPQTTAETSGAANSIQESPTAIASATEPQFLEVKIPAGTALDIQATHSVSSKDAELGDLISFRVLVPVKVGDSIVIGSNALVTAQIAKAKRAGHWGKAGKLTWMMRDVVAVDLTRVSLAANADYPGGAQGVTGQSHGGEVATRTIVMGALLAPTIVGAPLALMHGFKRGEQAVLSEGKRLVVYVQKDTIIRIPNEIKVPRIDR